MSLPQETEVLVNSNLSEILTINNELIVSFNMKLALILYFQTSYILVNDFGAYPRDR